MRKLNKGKIRWIVREAERMEHGVWTIAQQQKITPHSVGLLVGSNRKRVQHIPAAHSV